nr:uncharacterized protein LOC121126285 [Lepeophtheirus salmonis]
MKVNVVICILILAYVSTPLAQPKTVSKPVRSNWMAYLDPSYWISNRKSSPNEQKRLRFNLLRRRLEERRRRPPYNKETRVQSDVQSTSPVNRRLELPPFVEGRKEDHYYDYYDNYVDSKIRTPARPTPNCVCRCDCCDCCPCLDDDKFTYIDT